MVFYKVTSDDPVVDYITEALSSRLKSGQRVLWFVTGGSGVEVAAKVSKRLVGMPLEKLTVTLTDERYGPVGHPDSNWFQLEQVGFVLPGAALRPVLAGNNRETTVTNFEKLLEQALNETDYRLGFFGLGADGHASGILPHSPAVHNTSLVASYDAGPYRRITTTPVAIARLNEAVIYAIGQSKRQALDQLETDMPIDDQPAQILKQVPKLTIFNDQKGVRL